MCMLELLWLDPVLKALGLRWTFTSIIYANDSKAAMVSNDILRDKRARKEILLETSVVVFNYIKNYRGKKFVSCFKFAFSSDKNCKTFILMVFTINVIG